MKRTRRNLDSSYHKLRAVPITNEILTCPVCSGMDWRIHRAGSDSHATVYECRSPVTSNGIVKLCASRFRRVHLINSWMHATHKGQPAGKLKGFAVIESTISSAPGRTYSQVRCVCGYLNMFVNANWAGGHGGGNSRCKGCKKKVFYKTLEVVDDAF